jgi:hypothetical protein
MVIFVETYKATDELPYSSRDIMEDGLEEIGDNWHIE